MSAPNIAGAPLPQRARGYWRAWIGSGFEWLEKLLEVERAQLPPWAVIGFGGGIAAWFALDTPTAWAAFISLAAGVVLAGFGLLPGRSGRALGWLGLTATLGCALVWARAMWVETPRLDRPAIVDLHGTVERVEVLTARQQLRLTIHPSDHALPPRVRVSIDPDDAPSGIAADAEVRMRARLAPPPTMALPGTYDFARDAWFWQIGGVGKALGPVTVIRATPQRGLEGLRERLRAHIASRLPERSSGIAIALATGDQNGVGQVDADSMRRSGLTHLLSVSGLHIAAVVGFAMFLTLRLLALSEWLALRFNLVLVAAGAGAATGIGYTILTGMQVPTVRSCVAALLVLLGIALGRDALSMRLVATGALIVMLFRPEALAGPSFQMSFAAVTAIVALHSTRWSARWFGRREEPWMFRLLRALGATIATGLVVEVALMPLALFHFHRSGLYGVAANIIAIPLTTFVIMPLEALALIFDPLGLGGPFWWATGVAIDGLLDMSGWIATRQGAVAMLPTMPGWAFAAMVAGGLWLALWTTRVRRWGLVLFALGALGAAGAPTPDLLVTGDGRHLALLDGRGVPVILRDRAGDYVRHLLAETSGFDGDVGLIDDQPFADCSRDACFAVLDRGGRSWRILATRSRDTLGWRDLIDECAAADIVVSERRLPPACRPRWLKLDRTALGQTGGVALVLGPSPAMQTVAERVGDHPWRPAVPAASGRPPHPNGPRSIATHPARFPTDR